MKKEFTIMPDDLYYSTKRTSNTERHEIFFGRAYRQKSINDGLVVFLMPERHRGTYGVHGRDGHTLDEYLKRKAQQAWQEHYNKTKEEFRQRYGKSYL